MSRALLLISALTLLASTGCSTNDVPKSTLTAMRHADRYELLSLDPSRTPTPPPGTFHGWRVLGRTAITDIATQKKLNDALRAGAHENRVMVAACFKPRHGIHVVSGEQSVDIVICFECLQAMTFAGDQSTESFLISRSPQPLFDKVLNAAGVPLAEKPE